MCFNYELWSCIMLGCLLLYHMFSLCTRMTTWKWKTLKIPNSNPPVCSMLLKLRWYSTIFCLLNFASSISKRKKNSKPFYFVVVGGGAAAVFSIPFNSIQLKREMKWKMAQELYANWFENFIIRGTVCVCVSARVLKRCEKWMNECMSWQSETDSKIRKCSCV